MNRFMHAAVGAASLVAVAGCTKPGPAAVDTAADQAAVSAIGEAWFKGYDAGDTEGVVALYAEDGVLSPPGAPSARGRAAIREFLTKDIAGTIEGGYQLTRGSAIEIGVSGDLAWDWDTFTVTDKSGATVDTGKYVTLYAKQGGKWVIIRDIWSSDAAPPS